MGEEIKYHPHWSVLPHRAGDGTRGFMRSMGEGIPAAAALVRAELCAGRCRAHCLPWPQASTVDSRRSGSGIVTVLEPGSVVLAKILSNFANKPPLTSRSARAPSNFSHLAHPYPFAPHPNYRPEVRRLTTMEARVLAYRPSVLPTGTSYLCDHYGP